MAPFDSFHSVTSPLTAVLDDAPFRGRTFHQRLPGAGVDIGGHCSGPRRFRRPAASCDSEGGIRPATSGANTMTSRFASGNQSAASAFISFNVISGRKRR